MMRNKLIVLVLALLVVSTWAIAGYDLGAGFMHVVCVALPGCAITWIAHCTERD